MGTLWLNRPDKLNALSADMWEDIPKAVAQLEAEPSVRVIVVAGRGEAFTAGIDISMLAGLSPSGPSPAANARAVYQSVRRLQGTFDSLADTSKPVIAAIHGWCLGAGMSLISACDLRLAAADAVFSLRETRMGLVADVGALQRLPSSIGAAATAEMALTGDDFPASWASDRGLVSEVLADRDRLLEAAGTLAARIAANSPLVTTGIKKVLQASLGRPVEEGLDFVARWNSANLLSNDLTEAITAFIERRPPRFTGD